MGGPTWQCVFPAWTSDTKVERINQQGHASDDGILVHEVNESVLTRPYNLSALDAGMVSAQHRLTPRDSLVDRFTAYGSTLLVQTQVMASKSTRKFVS